MSLSPQDQRNYAILAAFVLGAGYFLYSEFSTPDGPAPGATVVTAPAAAKPRTAAAGTVARLDPAQLDPTLHPEAMLVTESLVYSGNGRNIFSPNSAPEVEVHREIAKVKIPEPVAPVRPGRAGPAPPPPIDLKFFGTETNAAGTRRAFLLHGEDVFVVSSGDIVQRRYRVISIDARSMLVEDIANANKQTLPLLAN